MNGFVKNIRFSLGSKIANSTSLFWINYLRKDTEKLIRRDSEICIEGFQRSGNSFFISLFRRKNPAVRVAHHTHGAAQVTRAIAYEVPTIVLIRQPRDAVASLMVWDERLHLDLALKSWIQFYATLIPDRRDVMIVSFEDVIKDPSIIIEQFNQRFETKFHPPKFAAKDLIRFKEKAKERNSPLSGPLPTKEKEEAKQKYYTLISDHPLYAQACELYAQFVTEA